MSGFFVIHQNNSHGVWTGPAAYIIVEADCRADGVALLEQHISICHDDGSYGSYDVCGNGCCPCCGHRWEIYDWDEPVSGAEAHRSVFARFLSSDTDLYYMGAVRSSFVSADGALLVGDTDENVAIIKQRLGVAS